MYKRQVTALRASTSFSRGCRDRHLNAVVAAHRTGVLVQEHLRVSRPHPEAVDASSSPSCLPKSTAVAPSPSLSSCSPGTATLPTSSWSRRASTKREQRIKEQSRRRAIAVAVPSFLPRVRSVRCRRRLCLDHRTESRVLQLQAREPVETLKIPEDSSSHPQSPRH